MSVTIKALTFTLLDLEKTVYRRDYITYEQHLIELLDYLNQGGHLEIRFKDDEQGQSVRKPGGLHPISEQMPLDQKTELYTRLAACITAHLSDTAHTPSVEVLMHLILLKTRISQIFYLSGFENMDHILWNRDLLNNDFSLNLKTELDIKYLLACYTLNSRITIDVAMLVGALPGWGVSWYLGLLYHHHHSYNQRILNNFNKLVANHHAIENLPSDPTSIELMISPWMLCSYWDIDNRHAIKKSFNRIIHRWVTQQLSPGLHKRIQRQIVDTKAIHRIVVLSEKYTTPHAMYRCYHPMIADLKNSYDVTLVSAKRDYDENSSKDFHRVVEVEDNVADIVNTIKKIAKLKPDLIIFPSLGMAKWTVPLANIRLAKKQIMCYGHPASAFSEFIDYGYTSGFKEGPNYQNFCQEKLLPHYEMEMATLRAHPDFPSLTETQKPNDGIVRIAINSSEPKISHQLINLCAILKENSSVPIEFHFFLIGQNSAFEKSLNERLGRVAVVHGFSAYPEYMTNLSLCDIAIGTYPFGGANTNVDLALLGIPKVIYTEGSDLASFADLSLQSRLELPDILQAKSEADLLSKLIYLIHNKAALQEISSLIKSQDPYDRYYTLGKSEKRSELINAVKWIDETDYK